MAKKCDQCGQPATHVYSGSQVCENDYKILARIDESPNRIPANYDWSAEMNSRQLPEG